MLTPFLPSDRRNLVVVQGGGLKSSFPSAQSCNNNNRLDKCCNTQPAKVLRSVTVAEAAAEAMANWRELEVESPEWVFLAGLNRLKVSKYKL